MDALCSSVRSRTSCEEAAFSSETEAIEEISSVIDLML